MNKDNIIGTFAESLGNALILASAITGIGVLCDALPVVAYLAPFTAGLFALAVGSTVSVLSARSGEREELDDVAD